MIYFDNAATTKYKPETVYDSFNYYIREIGVSPGRGSYRIGIEASRMLFKSRKTVGTYFGCPNVTSIVFTKNSTEAINMFFNSVLKKGNHVIISPYEHNAVLRPLHYLKENGMIDYSIIDRNDLNKNSDYILNKYAKSNTKLLAMTLASNLTGRIIFNSDLYYAAHKKGIITFVDSSQGAGKIRLNMKDDNIDYLAFTGHKDLLSLPGVGGLCCSDETLIKPLIQGGTGIHGEEYTNPNIFPEGLESGTLNMPAIWSLKNSIDYICENYEVIRSKEKELFNKLIDGLQCIEKVIIYDKEWLGVPTVGINYKGMASNVFVKYLDDNGICVRGGIHCAIIAHESLNTVETGVVRISLNYMNSINEIDELIDVIKKLEK